jgi:hypothetical protein
MSRQPAARASAARDNVAYTDVYRPGALAEIRALIPDDVLDTIDHLPGASWLDFEYDHWLMDATMQVLGQEDAIRCWRKSLTKLIERPLLRSFVEGGLRIFGARPGKLLKLVPKGWSLAYRDFCVPVFELLEPGRAELRFEDIAPQAFDAPGYMHCWHGICCGVFDLEKPKDGAVEFAIERARARAVARFSWSE